MKNRLLMTIMGLCLVAAPAMAQTAAEQLQRAMFSQDALGNLDNAIAIYTQLATSPLTPRDIAAHAQYRLTLAQAQKGDAGAATRALERLEKDFADYRGLVEGAASIRKPPAATPIRSLVRAATVATAVGNMGFDGAVVSLQGKITEFGLSNSSSVIVLESPGQKYFVVLAGFSTLQSASAIRRDSFKLGETLTILARRPSKGPQNVDGFEIVRAQTITTADGKVFENPR